jgi:hypothetical protein
MCAKLKIMLLMSFVTLSVSACMTWADLERQREQAHEGAGHEIRSNTEVANSIVNAIDHFELDEGQLPLQLEALVPDYLTSIPKTTDGGTFGYAVDSLDGYYLCFDVVSLPNLGCCYNDRLQLWDCSFGVE